FLEYLQRTAFDFFWYEANPANGLIRDRSTRTSFCSIAAVGFGLTGIGIAIDHGWISREAGRERVRTTLKTFWEKSQGATSSGHIGYKGWFYHFLNMNTATRFGSVELSSIDTALLVAGIIYVREYFSGADPIEQEIRTLADAIVHRIDWSWMARNGARLSHGWLPESGFLANNWIGYNEAMILYILGLGAATNPLPAASWTAWTSQYLWRTNYGFSYVQFEPLFGHQYSHCWIDFRYIADEYMRGKGSTYFENSRRATLAQRAYCATRRGFGYSTNVWGLTACDGPGFGAYLGYSARGAPPPFNDDGTIAPTAPGGSLPFAPEVCLPALRYLYDTYRTNLWTGYGFRDAFNLVANWWGPDVLGIDQGPILIMAENFRNRRVWQVMMRNEQIRRGLERAGFQRGHFARPRLEPGPLPRTFSVAWQPDAGRNYQVEYSPDLFFWLASPTGFFTATGEGAELRWVDEGFPATEQPPMEVAQRFYRVFRLGAP
ncbi:MAG: glucoamylase family protein, partial [Verrucomicrobiota bacterium]